MVYRLQPENVRPQRGGPSGALAIVLVLVVVIGVWLISGREPGTPTGTGGAEQGAVVSTGALAETDPESGLRYVAATDLPDAALDVMARHTDGTLASTGVDGEPFSNGAGLLPAKAEGYYVLYPVTEADVEPGTEQLVRGEAGEWYWSADGGWTFLRVGP
ncbi:ribonuclease domain-containing protein [Nocardioides bruguierae]|uniref:ribonuclease domain-containing protein n=1 Tax=Nocardioides bruguierae TaxID=2945102 RepID=UPI0020220FD5|nr:ribonuclease domain-containing protein [Nocardioides bruguierae]MCL8027014.1 hypothetical protein [Nocardioides bruguierae]